MIGSTRNDHASIKRRRIIGVAITAVVAVVSAYEIIVQRDDDAWFQNEKLLELPAQKVDFIIESRNSHRCKTIFRMNPEQFKRLADSLPQQEKPA